MDEWFALPPFLSGQNLKQTLPFLCLDPAHPLVCLIQQQGQAKEQVPLGS